MSTLEFSKTNILDGNEMYTRLDTLLYGHQKLKIYSTLCVLSGLSHLSWFQGLKYISPSFFPYKLPNHTVVNFFEKNIHLVTALFHDVKKLRRKPKIDVKVIQRF